MASRHAARSWALWTCRIQRVSSRNLGGNSRRLQTLIQDDPTHNTTSQSSKDEHVGKATPPSYENGLRLDSEVAPLLNEFSERSHTCGQLRSSDVGRRVVLCGWVSFKRLFFLLLRDGYGVTQVIIESDAHQELLKDVSLESVLRIEGVVRLRPEGQARAELATGEIEVLCEKITVLNTASNLPFIPRDYQNKKESLRLQYRYLDLREKEMQFNLRLRSRFTHAVRRHLVEQLGFCEVETPTLFRRTPGGAREFPVACHSFPGHFYSLTQSPQQFKQLLMVGGIDRYFQIARCYRDEGSRPDRQPEFTQIDLEMSFVKQSDVMATVENLVRSVWPKDLPETPFPIMSHSEAMSKYGTDKPDTRYDFLLEDATKLFPGLFKEGIINVPYDERAVMLINWPGGSGKINNRLAEEWRAQAKIIGQCGVIPASVNEVGSIRKSIAKHMELEEYKGRFAPRDLLVVAWGRKSSVQKMLANVRTDIARLSGALDKLEPEYQFLWVTDFPLFTKENGALVPEHHPFTAPVPEDEALLATHPEKARGQHFDLVLNGCEIGGGSIRIHDAATQSFVLKDLLGEDTSQLKHLLEALSMGAPPHGGFALGLDRILAVLCRAPSIRDVIAFPKSFEGKDLMAEAPAPLSPQDLEHFHLTGIKDGGVGSGPTK